MATDFTKPQASSSSLIRKCSANVQSACISNGVYLAYILNLGTIADWVYNAIEKMFF